LAGGGLCPPGLGPTFVETSPPLST